MSEQPPSGYQCCPNCNIEEKTKRLDAVQLEAEQEIHLCDKLAKSVLDPQGLAHARGCRGAAERVLKIVKGESDDNRL